MERTVQAWKPPEALNERSMPLRDEEYEQDLAAWRRETGRSGNRRRSERRFAAYWAENHQRRFAIESGEIEGLYRLRAQAKEFLVRHGLEHTTELALLDAREQDRPRKHGTAPDRDGN